MQSSRDPITSIDFVSAQPIEPVKTRSERLRLVIAQKLFESRPKPNGAETVTDDAHAPQPITIVCLSDTHNERSAVPPGDVLIHAGDFSRSGTEAEIQNQLSWLASLQGYKYKIVIAGNHDKALQQADKFLRGPSTAPIAANGRATNRFSVAENTDAVSQAKYKIHDDPDPKSAPDASPTTEDSHQQYIFNFGDLIYLRDSPTTVGIAGRTLSVHGAPWTPEYGSWAFTYPRNQDDVFWRGKLPRDADIVIAHGPPKGYLDAGNDGRGHGSLGLLRELHHARPRLFVCGHIHGGRGRADVVFDDVTGKAERVRHAVSGGSGASSLGMAPPEGGKWTDIAALLLAWVFAWLKAATGRRDERLTTLINAASAPAAGGKDHRGAIIVEI